MDPLTEYAFKRLADLPAAYHVTLQVRGSFVSAAAVYRSASVHATEPTMALALLSMMDRYDCMMQVARSVYFQQDMMEALSDVRSR